MIDTTMFGADIPAGTYAVGDTVSLGVVDGPAVVRSGRGAALLKRITCGSLGNVSGSGSNWKIHVKNSDWIDDAISLTPCIKDATALDERTGGIQRGHDCPLTPNSSWEVYAECAAAVTTTVPNSIFALIDVDYPSVSSIIDPDTLPGVPATIEVMRTGATLKALGTLVGSSAEIMNYDFFKAGYEYALEKVESTGSLGFAGFITISNAAGMAGLKRIIPIASTAVNIRNKIEYASKLVKGPLDIGLNLFENSATPATANIQLIMDFVKRRV